MYDEKTIIHFTPRHRPDACRIGSFADARRRRSNRGRTRSDREDSDRLAGVQRAFQLKENWHPVVGFEGLYEVSDQGCVRSIKRRVRCKASALRCAHWRTYPGKMLRPGRFTPSGHVSVVLGHRRNGSPVHQLVLTAFGQEGRHRNGIANDNRLNNLRYGTYADNIRDVFEHGGRKIDAAGVRSLRAKRKRGATFAELSAEFGICLSHVGNVVHRRRYAHV